MPMKPLLGAAGDTSTGTSIADPADTTADPTGTANHIDMTGGNEAAGFIGNGLLLIPFGTTTAAQTFLMSVFAVEKFIISGVPNWNYHLLAAFTCTLCTKTGQAGGLTTTQLYCDTIVLTANSGNANVSNEIISPTGNQEARIILDGIGAPLVKVVFARNGSAISCNTFYRII